MAPTRPPGAAVHPQPDRDQQHRKQGAARDTDLRAQHAGLCGKNQEQHDADEGHSYARDRQRLADPSLPGFAFVRRAGAGGAREPHGGATSGRWRVAGAGWRTGAGTR